MKAKRKRGRPALGPGKGRESVVVSFRLTKQQAKAIEDWAGLPVASYCAVTARKLAAYLASDRERKA